MQIGLSHGLVAKRLAYSPSPTGTSYKRQMQINFDGHSSTKSMLASPRSTLKTTSSPSTQPRRIKRVKFNRERAELPKVNYLLS
jgi:hypothetical protein